MRSYFSPLRLADKETGIMEVWWGCRETNTEGGDGNNCNLFEAQFGKNKPMAQHLRFQEFVFQRHFTNP